MFAGDSKNTDKSPLTTCNLRMAMRIKKFPSIFVAARRGWPMTAFAESDSGDVSGRDTSQSKHDGVLWRRARCSKQTEASLA
jgi:hypothetical protein